MTTATTPNAPFLPRAIGQIESTVADAVAGDARAIAALVQSIRPAVVNVCKRIFGGDRADRDDAIQLALIGFIQALPAYRGESDPAAYAKAIAVRAAIAVRRRVRTIASHREDDSEPNALESHAPTPSDVVISERRRALIRQLLAEIPIEQAEALAMRIVLGWSLDEIAARAGVPQNTVRSRIRLAKVALRKRIEASPQMRDALDFEV